MPRVDAGTALRVALLRVGVPRCEVAPRHRRRPTTRRPPRLAVIIVVVAVVTPPGVPVEGSGPRSGREGAKSASAHGRTLCPTVRSEPSALGRLSTLPPDVDAD